MKMKNPTDVLLPSTSVNETFPKLVDVEVTIERRGGNYYVKQNDLELTRFREEIQINKEAFPVLQTMKKTINTKRFIPPQFGITTLGNSHGFDASGSTSGFIVWVGGRGIMVDPPPFSSVSLKMEGIHPSLIEKVIISHCHADHDSGAFHKILEAEPVELLSTETILRSFLRKYSAITGVPLSGVNKLVRFRPVRIGHRIRIYGANFNFFYSFHSIPAIGFSVERDGKSFYFSGDTFYDPPTLKKFHLEKKLFNVHRYKELAEKDFSTFDVIFHEAGIPPIHTPQHNLDNQNKTHKHRHSKCKGIFLYHCTQSSLKHEELRIVPLGIHNTLVLADSKSNRTSFIANDPFRTNLELLSSVSLVSWLPINRMLELLDVLHTVQYSSGQNILKSGTFGTRFYIIKKGSIRVYSDEPGGFEKILGPCDTFGESSIFGDGSRLANVEAIADSELLEIEKFDFFWVFGDPSLPDASGVNALAAPIRRMKNLSKMRREKTAEFINENAFIRSLSETQKNQFNMLLSNITVSPGEVLWSKGDPCPFCFIVKEGKYQVIHYKSLTIRW
jgi:CRP-like cAMP-binding protein/glyoxylase-like metal-dependent hydrolase (beta-lactamase superfamily II)